MLDKWRVSQKLNIKRLKIYLFQLVFLSFHIFIKKSIVRTTDSQDYIDSQDGFTGLFAVCHHGLLPIVILNLFQDLKIKKPLAQDQQKASQRKSGHINDIR